MKRLCWPLASLLAVVIVTLLYLFVIRGSTLPASDGRTSIVLTSGERDLVLTEMRGFLIAVQQITQGVVDDDSGAIAVAARRAGGAATHEVPPSLVGKLPIEFKRLGFDTHSQFDRLALDTEQLGDAAHAQRALATLMQNCVACHAAYRFDLESR